MKSALQTGRYRDGAACMWRSLLILCIEMKGGEAAVRLSSERSRRSKKGSGDRARRVASALLVVALALLTSCQGSEMREDSFPALTNPPTVASGRKVNVVATTTQVSDFVRVVGG